MLKAMRNSAGRFWWGVTFLALAVIVLDLASKFYFLAQTAAGNHALWRWGWLHLTVQRNRGIAFSLPLSGAPLASVLIMTVMILAWFIYRHLRFDSAWSLVILGLLSGGALGNILTRLWQGGAVVDFIGVGSFPLFNLADSAITLSGLGLVLFWHRVTKS